MNDPKIDAFPENLMTYHPTDRGVVLVHRINDHRLADCGHEKVAPLLNYI
jgi:hypothetical protein